MKKLILITAMLFLLSGCVAIDSKYTGRSRMRIYNDFNRGYHFCVSPLPIPYHGWVFFYPGYYGHVYWKGSVYPRQQKQVVVVRGTISKRQLIK